MNFDKIYKGDLYEFKVKEKIGSGGNGEVYEIEIITPRPPLNKKYVVKFLSLNKMWGQKRDKRYKRFYKEIKTVINLQKSIPEIMPILDYYCPEMMKNRDPVWYIMYEAQSFREFIKINRIDLKTKLLYLLELSEVLSKIHSQEYYHRDIKIDNLLILNSKLMLSDFGLVWNIDDSTLTDVDERLGPYFFGPPELVQRDLAMVDFSPSDVYLFAKVVWMVLKNDNVGFRGEYKRENVQFYLDPQDYQIVTFEPLQQLLEKSTKISMNERIDINECKNLIIEQISIIENPKSEKVQAYRFEELGKEMINKTEPDVIKYQKFDDIFSFIDKILPFSNTIIESTNELISVNSIEKWSDVGSIILKSKFKISVISSYLLYPDYIEYYKNNGEIRLYIKEMPKEGKHNDFLSYKERKKGLWGGTAGKGIFFNEKLVLKLTKTSN